MKKIITDTGFWIGLCDEHDQFHRASIKVYESIKESTIYVPWPSFYEFLNTSFVQNKNAFLRFKTIIRRSSVRYIHDDLYREKAFEIFLSKKNAQREISLFDNVLRLIISDDKFFFDALVTSDYSDFHDVCKKRKLELYLLRTQSVH
jgi:predicted nucleic acid-binding protein